jgi:hypothetical protein
MSCENIPHNPLRLPVLSSVHTNRACIPTKQRGSWKLTVFGSGIAEDFCKQQYCHTFQYSLMALAHGFNSVFVIVCLSLCKMTEKY